MSKGMHWVYLIIISILLILVWQERQLPDASDRTQDPQLTSAAESDGLATTDSDRNIDMLLELMNSLQEDNRRLAAQVAQLEQQLLEQETETKSENGDARDVTIEREVERVRERRESVERAREYLSADDYRERIENEDVDPTWAYDMEFALQDMFRSNEALRDLDIQDIQCRTTICAIDIYSEESVVGGLNMPALFRHLNDQEWYSNDEYTMISFSESDSDTQRIMIVRRLPEGG